MTSFGLAALAVAVAALPLDLARRRIPNFLTLPALALGLIGHGVAGGPGGVAEAGAGALAGAALLLVPWRLGWAGAGDLKLLAALGALVGARPLLDIGLLAALASGGIAIGIAAAAGRLGAALGAALGLLAPARRRSGAPPGRSPLHLGTVPFAVPVFAGTCLWLVIGGVL